MLARVERGLCDILGKYAGARFHKFSHFTDLRLGSSLEAQRGHPIRLLRLDL
jgi:hypothetical protein